MILHADVMTHDVFLLVTGPGHGLSEEDLSETSCREQSPALRLSVQNSVQRDSERHFRSHVYTMSLLPEFFWSTEHTMPGSTDVGAPESRVPPPSLTCYKWNVEMLKILKDLSRKRDEKMSHTSRTVCGHGASVVIRRGGSGFGSWTKSNHIRV